MVAVTLKSVFVPIRTAVARTVFFCLCISAPTLLPVCVLTWAERPQREHRPTSLHVQHNNSGVHVHSSTVSIICTASFAAQQQADRWHMISMSEQPKSSQPGRTRTVNCSRYHQIIYPTRGMTAAAVLLSKAQMATDCCVGCERVLVERRRER